MSSQIYIRFGLDLNVIKYRYCTDRQIDGPTICIIIELEIIIINSFFYILFFYKIFF